MASRTRFCAALRAVRAPTRASRRSYSSATSAPGNAGSYVGRWAGVVAGVAVGAGLTYAMFPPKPAQAATCAPAKAPTRGPERFGSPEDYRAAVAELRSFLPEEDVSTDDDDREMFGGSEWTYGENCPPTAVVSPHSTEDVQRIVKICAKYRVPIIPYGSGTSLEGHFSAPFGGICVNLAKHMNRILAVHPQDGDVVVQAGVGYETLNKALADDGLDLFLPLDPGPNATVAGMLSTGCSGTNSVRYGTARAEWFLNVTAVLPDGSVVKTRQRSRKSSAGPDMTKLFIGAEGTLGIVTEVTVRLAPKLPTRVAIVSFPSIRDGVNAVVEVLNKGVNVQCAELLDALHVQAVNHMGIIPNPLPEKDTILFKVQGNEAMMAESERLLAEISKRHGSGQMRMSKDEDESNQLWAARKGALFAALGHSGYETPMLYGNDVCVPISALPDFVYACQQDLREKGVYGPIVGHVGDGNFHATIIMRDRSELPMVREIVSGFVKRAIALDGTCTGEHGVGMSKKKYLPSELGDGTVRLLRTIKDTLDPLGIMNPGKLYPDEPDGPNTPADYAPPAPACCA